MKTYKLYGLILTPVHIGDGTELDPYEYVIKDNFFYKINLANFLFDLPIQKQKEFYQIQDADVKGIRTFFRENIDLQRHLEYAAGISEEVKSLYETRIDNPANQLFISPFIRTMNRAYIPGSSLKGAIRTAVIFNQLKGEPKETWAEKLEGQVLRCLNRWERLDPSRDPFRAIKVTDSFLEDRSTIVDRVFIMDKKDRELHDVGMQIIREVTYPYSQGRPVKFESELRIDEELIKKTRGMEITTELIATSCNSFYRLVMNYDREKFFRGTEVEPLYERLINSLEENSFLLRLGWGSGFNSLTLNLKRERPTYIKTRRLTSKILPLGWIKATLEASS